MVIHRSSERAPIRVALYEAASRKYGSYLVLRRDSCDDHKQTLHEDETSTLNTLDVLEQLSSMYSVIPIHRL